MLPIDSIKLNPLNAREHSRKQIEKLMRSVSRCGLMLTSGNVATSVSA
jgi:hypothetical protein